MPNLPAQRLAKINEEINLQFVMKYLCSICNKSAVCYMPNLQAQLLAVLEDFQD